MLQEGDSPNKIAAQKLLKLKMGFMICGGGKGPGGNRVKGARLRWSMG